MTDLLVRALPQPVTEALRRRGVRARHSMQREATALVDESASHGRPVSKFTMGEAREVAARWRERLAGREFDDSTELTRRDRDSDHGHDY